MKTIFLYGQLAELYGPTFNLEVKSAAEAVKALHTQLPGFRKIIEAGNWHIIRGELDKQDADDEERLLMDLGEKEIHILPAVSGAGSNGGVISLIVGVVLIAVGYFTFGTTSAMGVAMIAGGSGLVAGGIIQMTMSTPAVSSEAASGDDGSFLFSGPRNRSEQGVAIPRGYGRCRLGSIVISAGLYAEELPIT